VGWRNWEGTISAQVERLGRAIRTPWVRTVGILTFVQVVTELAFSFALPFTPLYIQELGVTDLAEVGLWAGLIAGLFAVSMGVMAPIWGLVADRFGHRLMIQRASFGAGIGIALIAFVQTPEQLLVLRIVHGFFTGVVSAIATLVSLTAPRQHLGTVLGMLQAAMFTGVSLGPLLGGAFVDQFGLRAAFFSTGVILFLAGLLVTACVSEPVREPRRTSTAAGAEAESRGQQRLFRRDVIAVVGLMALTRFAMMAPQPFLPLFVQQLVDSQEGLATTVGLVLAAMGIASTVGALMVGRTNRWFGERPALIGCLVLSAVISALHVGVSSVWQLMVLRTALGLALGGTGPAIQALLIDATPSGRRGAAFGLLTMANSAGSGAGPVLGGALMAGFGVQAVFLSSAPAFALAGWVVARLKRRPAQPAQHAVQASPKAT
jgi:MFS transporter, DHA1 family, multidrug resistance protein